MVVTECKLPLVFAVLGKGMVTPLHSLPQLNSFTASRGAGDQIIETTAERSAEVIVVVRSVRVESMDIPGYRRRQAGLQW